MASVERLSVLVVILGFGLAESGRLVQLLTLTSKDLDAGMIWPTGKVRWRHYPHPKCRI